MTQAGLDLVTTCKQAIERQARFDVRWTDGLLTEPFTRLGWVDRDAGELVVLGDAIEVQTDAGGYVRSHYSCVYNVLTKGVLSADLEPGKLPVRAQKN